MSPVVVEAEVDINRPPEEVFDYCSDHRHEPEWNPMMTRIAKLTGGPVGAGTRYAAEFVKGPPIVMECTRYERPATWSLTGDSPVLTARRLAGAARRGRFPPGRAGGDGAAWPAQAGRASAAPP